MRRPQGYQTVTCNDTGLLLEEEDTYTCGHGGEVVAVKPGQVDTDSCRICDSHLCPRCAAIMAKTLKCNPLERQFDALERVDLLLRRMIG